MISKRLRNYHYKNHHIFFRNRLLPLQASSHIVFFSVNDWLILIDEELMGYSFLKNIKQQATRFPNMTSYHIFSKRICLGLTYHACAIGGAKPHYGRRVIEFTRRNIPTFQLLSIYEQDQA